MNHSSEYEHLFQPLTLGNLTLPNRVVMTTVKLGYSNRKGEATPRHIAFYQRRAEGEVGLITTEPMVVQPNGIEIPTQLGVYQDDLVPGLQRLTEAVHAAGGRIMAHINHAGRVANPNLVAKERLVSASDVFCPANSVTPRPLLLAEIDEVVEAFGMSAGRILAAGFDAIEIPFSHGYLIHQFLSPHTNRREDEYGGSFQNRLRFGRAVIRAARARVGADFPIVVRMNATDYVEGGLTIQDALDIAREIEAMGVNALSVTSGTMCESIPFCLYPNGAPKANLLPMAAQMRGVVSLPIIVAGRVRTPAIAQEALAAGQADLIGLGRPFLSDPDWVKKAHEGRTDEILLCAACHQGCLAELRLGHGSGCVFSPLTGREAELTVATAAHPRRIMVVGGGPAGLEAAAIAAQRGHQVSLYEQENHLGGQFVLAAKAPHKEELNDVIKSMILSAQRAGVQIHLNTRMTSEMIRNSKVDALILATGGIPLTLPFQGLEESHWLLAADLLEGAAQVTTSSALVIGGGLVGLETADFLAIQGVKVTLVEMLDDVGGDMDILAKTMLLKRLRLKDVKILVKTKVQRLTRSQAIVQQADQEIALDVETVVIAVGVRANRELPDAFKDWDQEVYVIGDAAQPRKALEAILEGFNVGNSV